MADGFELSLHARQMLQERGIREDWLRLALDEPERVEERPDGTTHYLRAIAQHGGRTLRVVLNAAAQPQRVVTVFFDRRAGRRQ